MAVAAALALGVLAGRAQIDPDKAVGRAVRSFVLVFTVVFLSSAGHRPLPGAGPRSRSSCSPASRWSPSPAPPPRSKRRTATVRPGAGRPVSWPWAPSPWRSPARRRRAARSRAGLARRPPDLRGPRTARRDRLRDRRRGLRRRARDRGGSPALSLFSPRPPRISRPGQVVQRHAAGRTGTGIRPYPTIVGICAAIALALAGLLLLLRSLRSSATATTTPRRRRARAAGGTGGRASLGRPPPRATTGAPRRRGPAPHAGRGAARRVPAARTVGRQGRLRAAAFVERAPLPGLAARRPRLTARRPRLAARRPRLAARRPRLTARRGSHVYPPRHPLRTGTLRARRRWPGPARGRRVQGGRQALLSPPPR